MGFESAEDRWDLFNEKIRLGLHTIEDDTIEDVLLELR